MGRWIKYGALLLLSSLFLVFGVHILIASYRLNDPFSFVMTFFASNLIILISGVGVAAFLIRLVQWHRSREKERKATSLPQRRDE
jgi:hypothetical protein